MNKKALVQLVVDEMLRISAPRRGHQEAIRREIRTPGVLDTIADRISEEEILKAVGRTRGRKKQKEE